MRSLSLPSTSFLFGEADISVIKILGKAAFESYGKMGWEKKKKAVNFFIQIAPIKCNQVQARMGFAVLEASQGTKTCSHFEICVNVPTAVSKE